MLLPGVPAAVFAQVAAPVTQDFDNVTPTDSVTDLAQYGITFSANDAAVSIVDDGYGGGNCLHIKEDGGSYFRAVLQPIVPAENKPVHTVFKYKIVDDKDAARFVIGQKWNDYIYNIPGEPDQFTSCQGSKMEMTNGEWYDVHAVMEIGKTTITISDGTNSVTGTRNYSGDFMITNSPTSKGVVVKDSEIAIDEIEIFQTDEAAAPEVISCTPANDAAGLSRKPEFAFKFDQAIGGSAAVTLAKYDEAADSYETAAVSTAASFAGRNGFNVSVTSLLDADSKYQLTLTGLTNFSGSQTMSEYTTTFTTEVAHKIKAEVSPVAAGEAGETVTATVAVKDDVTGGSLTVDGIILSYIDGKMSKIVKFFNDESVTDGVLNLSFPMPAREPGESFKLLLFESTKATFIPIASAISLTFID